MSRTLVALYAHPDDEAFGTGGTLATYAADGQTRVVLVCATRGEVGEISDPSLASRETLGQVREGELRCAAAALGIHHLEFLDYRDSGMIGTDENADPRAFYNAPAAEVLAKVVAIVRRERPDVIVTFDPGGGYGHPDHITIHRAAMMAYALSNDPALFPGTGEPWQPQRVFWSIITRGFFKRLREQMVAAGMPLQGFASREDFGTPDDQVTAVIDVSAAADKKMQSFRCHATQMQPNSFMTKLPPDVLQAAFSRETFTLAAPLAVPGQRLSDLFEGLD